MKKLILILTIIFGFNTAHSQFYHRQSKPEIIKIDTITNIEAASKCLTLSGDKPNQAIQLAGGYSLLSVALGLKLLDSDEQSSSLAVMLIPVGIFVGVNYWIKTYRGNTYLQKAGKFLSEKGENGLQKIDGKYYYIKYDTK